MKPPTKILIEYFQAEFTPDWRAELLKAGGLNGKESFDIERPFHEFETWIRDNYPDLVNMYKMEEGGSTYVSWVDLMNELEAPIQKEFLRSIF